jgi:sigma-B regulation protein RsbU (phosphoserine phosphatase)
MELGEQRRICVSSSLQNVRKLAEFCRKTCEGHFTEKELFEIELAIVEAANNIVVHSYKRKEGKPLECNILCEKSSLKFILINTGIPFNESNFNQDKKPDSVHEIPENGRGLFLMNVCMDQISFMTEGTMNILMMVKKLEVPMEETYDYYPFLQNFTAGSELTKREMQTAINLYRNFIPTHTPDIAGLKIFAKTEPALVVGGDLMTFFKKDEDTLWFVVCDVMGKGMSAAFFSMLSHMAFKSVLHMAQDTTPGQMISAVNRIMAKDFDRFGMFMTALIGTVKISEKTIYYASAGHCPPIMYSDDHGAELLDTDDFMMGVNEDTEYTTYNCSFNTGMKIMAYTDGITDIVGPNGEMVGIEPLLYACSSEFKTKTVTDACEKIFAEALIVSGNQLQDDLTMIGIEMI